MLDGVDGVGESCLDFFRTKLIQADEMTVSFQHLTCLSCGKLWKMGSRVWLAHKGAFALMDVMTNQ